MPRIHSARIFSALIATLPFSFLPPLSAQTTKKKVISAKTPPPSVSKSHLEHLGVPVFTDERGSYGLVILFPDHEFDSIITYMKKHNIPITGSNLRSEWACYVPVKDFYKAYKLLLQIKPQLTEELEEDEVGRLWIWEPNARGWPLTK